MRNFLAISVCLIATFVMVQCAGPSETEELSISLDDLRDRIEGGWAAQMVGVAYGYPTEFVYNQRLVPEEDMPARTPDMVANALDQDDLYVEMKFAQVLDDKGLDATTEDFGDLWKNAQYRSVACQSGCAPRTEAGCPRGANRHAATQCACQ